MKFENIKEKRGKYGIKAYGTWTCFDKKGEYINYLMHWISSTEGAERDRAVDALIGLSDGMNFFNTDC